MRSPLCIVLIALFVTAGGCQTKPPQAPRDDEYAGSKYPNVVGIGGLADDLSVGRPRVEPGPSPPLRVNVPVRLRRDQPQAVQYRFLFLDAAGAPVRDRFGWSYLTMEPRVQTFFSGGALSPDATDWRLEIREASRGVQYE